MSNSNASEPNNTPANTPTETSPPIQQADTAPTNDSAADTPPTDSTTADIPPTDSTTADIPPDNSILLSDSDITVNIETDDAEFFKKVGTVVFQKSNAILLIWFLAIYILVYFVLGMFFGTGTDVSNFQKNLGRLVDLIFLGGLLVYAFVYYYSSPEGKFNQDIQSAYEETIHYLNRTMSLLTTTLFIATLYIIVYLFRIPMSSEAKPLFISLI